MVEALALEYLQDPLYGGVMIVSVLFALGLVGAVLRLISRWMHIRAHVPAQVDAKDLGLTRPGGYRAYLHPRSGTFTLHLQSGDEFDGAFEVESAPPGKRSRGKMSAVTASPDFDERFPMRVPTGRVFDRFEVNRAWLDAVVEQLEPWGPLVNVRLGDSQIAVSFQRGVTLEQSLRVLLRLTRVADYIYSAAFFPPLKPPLAADHAGAYRARAAGVAIPSGRWTVEQVEGEPLGPFDFRELEARLHDLSYTPMTRIREEGSSKWTRVGRHPDFKILFDAEPENGPGKQVPRRLSPRYRGRRYLASRAALAVAAGLVIAGGQLAAQCKVAERRAAESTSWPAIDGKIIESVVTKTRSSSNSGSTKTTYSPKIEYEYRVAGVRYENDRLWFGGSTSGKQESQALVDRYPKGQAVKVYYRPRDPALSTLERGGVANLFLPIVIGLLLFGLGLLLSSAHALYALRRRTTATAA